jgi:signal transduction histidine kinase
VDLRQVLDKSLVFCEHLVHESRTEVLCSVPDTLPPVSGSHGQLIQVFVNLITNACHAMSASGGTLRIEASYPGSGKPVTVTLLDTGPGILPENLPRVFEPFFTTKDKASGTGLGLSVVRHIVTRSGGQVSAQSPGRGALFTITLPPHWADERPTDPR